MFISDRYEIIDIVGSGGMADVYKAKDDRLNRFVAIKVLKPEYSSDKSFVNKFRGEAQSVAGLSHPNIVNVYDVGDDGGLYYIVMELVEGITLKRFIERKGKLEVKEAVGIAIQIAQGMELPMITILYTGISNLRISLYPGTERLGNRLWYCERLLIPIRLPLMPWDLYIIYHPNRQGGAIVMRKVISTLLE